MDIFNRLQANWDLLHEQYQNNINDVEDLKDTLVRDVLPSAIDELDLGPDAFEWAKDWLLDTSSVFRISRRNKFTRSFSLEAIQKNLLWRLTNLWPLEPPPTVIPNLRCLPPDVRDPFGRPILIIEVTPIDEDTDSQKHFIIQAFEQLSIVLRTLCNEGQATDSPLQYVAILDLQYLSLQSVNVELFTWTLREIIPRFPGMIAGVFMVNYSWAHSGLWELFKRLLPENALSRIFFPSRDDLIQYFTPAALPKEYGGSLPSLASLHDPLRPIQTGPEGPAIVPEELQTSIPVPARISWLSPTSHLNPYFGYPVLTTSNQPPSFRHGRRRKRDLARTLATLFWLRWKNQILTSIFLSLALIVLRLGTRRGIVKLPKAIRFWKLHLPNR